MTADRLPVSEIIEALSIGGWPKNLGLTPEEALDANGDYLAMMTQVEVRHVDGIVEARDGRWIGVEVKPGVQRVDQGAANLMLLREKLSPEVQERCGALVVVVADSPTYTRPDGVVVTSIAALGP